MSSWQLYCLRIICRLMLQTFQLFVVLKYLVCFYVCDSTRVRDEDENLKYITVLLCWLILTLILWLCLFSHITEDWTHYDCTAIVFPSHKAFTSFEEKLSSWRPKQARWCYLLEFMTTPDGRTVLKYYFVHELSSRASISQNVMLAHKILFFTTKN